jgi:hypothetical protein
MKQATIYYYVEFDPRISSLKNIYDSIRFGNKAKYSSVSIKKGTWKRNWRMLPKKEKVSANLKLSFEKLFEKYNNYTRNPYSSENDIGQITLKKLGLDHTSMSVGDVIKVDNKYWMVADTGFSRIKFT